MKKIVFLSLFLLMVKGISAQTYFEQNFDSSNSLASYHGSPVTKNKFDAIAVLGNTTAEIFNNKLRIIKRIPASGNSRVGITRRTLFEGMPATGASFLKFSMEVTVSGNTVNINDGFGLFFVQAIVNAADPNAPGTGAGIHSSISIDPRETEGSFRLRSNTQISEAVSGTQTIEAYINNSGTSVGYMAPDGLPATLDNDMLDVWAIDNNGNTKLLLTQVVATGAANNIRNFKIAANPNFSATLDIDNILLAEQPKIPVKKVVSIAAVEPITVPEKTIFEKIPFPATANVTYDDGTSEMRDLVYSQVGTYNMFKLGTYAVRGTVVPKRGTVNPDLISVSTSVIIRSNIYINNTFTPNGDGKNDVWIVPDLQRYSNVLIEVYDRDGKRLFQTSNPNEGWDGKNQRGQVISGSYFYIINLPPLSLVKKGVLTIIK